MATSFNFKELEETVDDVLRLVGKINRAIHEQNETGMFLNDDRGR